MDAYRDLDLTACTALESLAFRVSRDNTDIQLQCVASILEPLVPSPPPCLRTLGLQRLLEEASRPVLWPTTGAAAMIESVIAQLPGVQTVLYGPWLFGYEEKTWEGIQPRVIDDFAAHFPALARKGMLRAIE